MDSFILGGHALPAEIGGMARHGAVDRERSAGRGDALPPGELVGALHGFRVGGQPII